MFRQLSQNFRIADYLGIITSRSEVPSPATSTHNPLYDHDLGRFQASLSLMANPNLVHPLSVM
jgi:hypothetical protein